MPQIGWFEILIIVVVAILVIGPKDFPKVLNKIGHWIDIKNKMTKLDEDITSDDPEQKYSKKNVENGEKKND